MSVPIQTIGSVDTPFYPATILVGRYSIGGAIAIQLTARAGPPETIMFSTNLVPYGAQLAPDEFNVKSWSENEPLVEHLQATGLFEDTGRTVPMGYVESPVWRVKDPSHVPPVNPRRRTTHAA